MIQVMWQLSGRGPTGKVQVMGLYPSVVDAQCRIHSCWEGRVDRVEVVVVPRQGPTTSMPEVNLDYEEEAWAVIKDSKWSKEGGGPLLKWRSLHQYEQDAINAADGDEVCKVAVLYDGVRPLPSSVKKWEMPVKVVQEYEGTIQVKDESEMGAYNKARRAEGVLHSTPGIRRVIVMGNPIPISH